MFDSSVLIVLVEMDCGRDAASAIATQ